MSVSIAPKQLAASPVPDGEHLVSKVANLQREKYDRFLSQGLLAIGYPADGMTMWPVDKRGGNGRNNDPSLIEPIALG